MSGISTGSCFHGLPESPLGPTGSLNSLAIKLQDQHTKDLKPFF